MTDLVNTLGNTTSPYLLQHKDNPVAWQWWNQDALELARQQDKPILLSIGYSACHWCHVMARESFEDQETATLMNDMFVNIKVDREERPDIDEVYQTAHQLLTGQPGGWPLTVFLCPRTHLPFLVGTYFPKQGTDQRIAFKELLEKVNQYYDARGKDFIQTIDQVRDSYKTLMKNENTLDPDARLSQIPIDKATIDLLRSADLKNGGFGKSPKFPMPTNLERLFVAQLDNKVGNEPARNHLYQSLMILARSGISDQLSGGFFRYSTDEKWMIPHFEKMLYDNGLLLAIFSKGFVCFQEPELKRAARGIVRWVLDEMRSQEGAFYSSMDADSEEQEGGYYLWCVKDIDEALTAQEKGVIHALYDLDKYANFEDKWHFHRERSWKQVINELELTLEDAESLRNSAEEKLRNIRSQRSPPHCDAKILTSWNGLMIRGLAIAARIFDEPGYLKAAQDAMDFIRKNLWINKRLYATWQQGKPRFSGYLNDYVFLMDGLLELLRVQWRDDDYRFLTSLTESLIENFEDERHGGFFFTAHDHEELIFRSKPFFDGVMPSGNGVAAKVFGRFGHLCAEPRYLECARRTLLSGWGSMLRHPKGHHSLLVGLAEYLESPVQILLKGDDLMQEWREKIQRQFGEMVYCYWVPSSSELHPPEMFLLDDNQAIVCVGDRCLEPQTQLEELLAQLSMVLSRKPAVI